MKVPGQRLLQRTFYRITVRGDRAGNVPKINTALALTALKHTGSISFF